MIDVVYRAALLPMVPYGRKGVHVGSWMRRRRRVAATAHIAQRTNRHALLDADVRWKGCGVHNATNLGGIVAKAVLVVAAISCSSNSAQAAALLFGIIK